MPVSATIPLTEDFLQTVATFSFITELIAHPTNGYIYGCYAPGPASIGGIVKISATNYTDITITTFVQDGLHTNPTDMVYVSQTDKFYVLFRIEGPSQLKVASVTPALVKADFITDSELNIGPGSITSDGTNLYIVSFNEDPSVLYAYSLTTGFYVPGASLSLTGKTQAHCIRYFGTKLYVTGIKPPTEGWIARCSTAGAVEQTATWLDAEGEFPVDDIGEGGDFVYVGKRDQSGVILKYTKTNFTTVESIATGQLSKCTCSKRGGDHVWTAFENGRGVRINPTSGDRRIYTLNEGQGYHSEFTGTNEFVHTYNLFSGKISRYHIPSDVVSGAAIWANQFGKTSLDVGSAVTVDVSGNIILAGYFRGTTNLGGIDLPSDGGSDIFLAKYDSSGGHLWSYRFGGTGDEVVTSVATDSSGNIFVAGYYLGASDLGGAALPTALGTYAFIAKYDSSGTHQWSKGFGSTSNPQGGNQYTSILSVAIDPSGNVVVGGVCNAPFSAPLNLGGSNLYSNSGARNLLLVKYSSAGAHQWSYLFTGFGGNPNGLAIDTTGDIYLSGNFQAQMDLGNGSGVLTVPSSVFSTVNMFVAKMNSAGLCQWSKQYGGENGESGNAIGFQRDTSGNITGLIVGGTFSRSTDLGGGTIPGYSVNSDGFIAKYSHVNGNFDWATPILSTSAGTGRVDLLSMKVDSNNNILVSGHFTTTVNASGRLLATSHGGTDAFAAKFNSSGVAQWGSGGHGGTADDQGLSLAVDSQGNAIFTGYFLSTAVIGGENMTSAGSGDGFLMKLAS